MRETCFGETLSVPSTVDVARRRRIRPKAPRVTGSGLATVGRGWWLAVVLCTLLPSGVAADNTEAAKQRAESGIDSQSEALVTLSEQVWDFAEIALYERRSAEVLADYAEAQGFRVDRGVAEMPSAFVATYGEGRPILGILGEYDALPGLSQEAVPEHSVRVEGGAGHGCGHNLFGPASLGAAVAIKELMDDGLVNGTIRFYGTPAEESVAGKLYMARAGLFDDLDAAIAWHPGQEITADTTSSQAVADLMVRFTGRTAHAAFDPWNGRSALDGVELFTHGINLLREHVRPTVRMHYAIVDGGQVPNVVPEHAAVWFWARDSTRAGVDTVLERVHQIIEGAALAAGVDVEVKVQNVLYEILVNFEGAKALHRNLERLGGLEWSDDEQAWARQLQQSVGVDASGLDGSIHPLVLDPGPPQGGSTDVGDVSWIAPTIHLSVTTAPADVPWHAWPVVASSGHAVGQRGMLYAAKALANTMVDLYLDGDLLAAMQAEFATQTEGHTYVAAIPEGPPPVPEGVYDD